MQTVVETCWNTSHRPSQILRKANDLLWDVEEGDWRSALCYVKVHPESGSIELASGGDLQAFIVGQHGFRMIRGTPTLLAEQPDTRFHNEQHYLEGGELFVVASANVLGGAESAGLTQEFFLETLRRLQEDAVEDIADYLARLLPVGPSHGQRDRSLLVIRRKF
jgi:serine phosphatase RsbU (regulator of sigma subunit)